MQRNDPVSQDAPPLTETTVAAFCTHYVLQATRPLDFVWAAIRLAPELTAKILIEHCEDVLAPPWMSSPKPATTPVWGRETPLRRLVDAACTLPDTGGLWYMVLKTLHLWHPDTDDIPQIIAAAISALPRIDVVRSLCAPCCAEESGIPALRQQAIAAVGVREIRDPAQECAELLLAVRDPHVYSCATRALAAAKLPADGQPGDEIAQLIAILAEALREGIAPAPDAEAVREDCLQALLRLPEHPEDPFFGSTLYLTGVLHGLSAAEVSLADQLQAS